MKRLNKKELEKLIEEAFQTNNHDADELILLKDYTYVKEDYMVTLNAIFSYVYENEQIEEYELCTRLMLLADLEEKNIIRLIKLAPWHKKYMENELKNFKKEMEANFRLLFAEPQITNNK